MQIEDLEARWQALSDKVIIGMKGWRAQHPKATWAWGPRPYDQHAQFG